MFCFKSLLFSVLIATFASAIPLQKRIAQTIADSTKDWEQACVCSSHTLYYVYDVITKQSSSSLLVAQTNATQSPKRPSQACLLLVETVINKMLQTR